MTRLDDIKPGDTIEAVALRGLARMLMDPNLRLTLDQLRRIAAILGEGVP